MSLTLTLARGGGEVSGSGTNIELDGTISGGAIESVELNGDTEQQTYSGKNLAYPLPKNFPDEGITATYNAQTGEITLSGTAARVYSIPFKTVDVSIPAGTYTIKQYGELSHGRIGINFRRANGTQFAEYVVEAGTLTNTFTLTEAAAKIYLFTLYHAQDQTVEGTVKFQMEAGNQATSFEPYVGGTASPNPDYPQEVQTVTGRQVVTISDGGSESQEYEINLGKNLANIPDCNISDKGYSLNIESGAIELNSTTINKTFDLCGGSAPANLLPTYANANDYHLTPTGGTWTLNASDISGTISGSQSLYVAIMTNQRQHNTFISSAMTYTPYTITLADDEYIKSIYLWCGSNTTYTSVKFKLQLEKGSTATTYAPYFTPIELCKIGTYQDYIYKSGEDWYVRKEINKYIIDGTNGNYTRITTNRFNISGWPMSYKMEKNANYSISDKYVTVQQYDTDGNFNSGTANMKFALGFHPLGGVRIKDSNFDDVNLYKAWVSSNPISAYAVLATPTDTQITNATLISELEDLLSATTYSGNTYITVSGDLASPLEVKASATITKTYTEVEIGSPFTIADVEGKSSNTTLDGNVYVDWSYNKKQYSFDLFNLTPQDYADIRAFYDYQFNNSAFPTITVPELNIDKLPVYMEISSRNIINQCLLTDKLTIKFRETVQP